MNCESCRKLSCVVRSEDNPKNCPMITSREVFEEARKIYEKDAETRRMVTEASIVEAVGYMQWPRLRDTIEFAKRMGYKKLGLAFCIGLQKEAEVTARILREWGFEVVSVMCKTGSFLKTEIGVPEEYTMQSKTGYLIGMVTCNPVAQALYLNKHGTELNIIVGLCVGHDAVFTKYSEAPVTTLIAKDRVLSHNPAAALYTYYWNSYWMKERV
ncbi:MAG: DUF1847 domain-containing protein [Archaeoglobus sp.]|uniref:DUF1847 domain-containing protein n=1 Tax=Archaeoglobus sp. TaxID=1872626 RepID=UPI001DCA49D1|nr:DUF1847 domain-containing protein [Archaeoglobus sp.]MBO8179376.1 DUF1847 domain-containing protein [Archaeoglobus sp.]